VVAPVLCGAIGAAIEIWGLRRVHHNGHIAELLFTFGLVFIIGRGVQMTWGMLPMPYRVPASLDFPLFTLYGENFPAYRGFMLLVSAGMLFATWLTTESAMADAMGPIVFVVVIFGGLGSLAGCFIASILMGMVQTFSVVIDYSVADVLKPFGVTLASNDLLGEMLTIPVSRIGPLVPYALLILILVLRPRGLMGTRET
jgi:branched-chain amino acid transport system permease protein